MKSAGMKKKTIGILLLLEVVTCLFVFRQYIFGDKLLAFTDIGSDTSGLYLSQYASIIRKIQTRDFSLWDPTNGFGINMNMLNMTNPALMMVYFLGAVLGTEHVPAMMLWVYLAEIVLSGIVIYLFLSLFSFREDVKLIVALMYFMNGFMTVWGEHYQFGIVPILVPLELIFVERYLKDRRKWLSLAVMTFVLVVNSMYIAYMTLIFSGCYVVVRLLMRKWSGIRTFLLDLLRAAGTMLLGVGLGGVTLVPSALAIMSVSSRMTSDDTPLLTKLFMSRYPREYYVTLVGRLLSTSNRGISIYDGYLNFFEGPCLFFTVVFVFLVVQYVFLLPGMKRSRRWKIMSMLAFLTVLVSIGLPAVGIVMNGFTAPFSRYFYLIMVCFACISAITLEEMIGKKRVNLIGILLSLGFLARFSYIYDRAGLPNYPRLVLIHAACGLAAAVLLALLRMNHTKVIHVCVVLLVLLVTVDTGADAWFTFDAHSNTQLRDSRIALTRGGSYFTAMYDPDTLAALDAIRAEEGEKAVRTEKLYGATLAMDAPVEGYMPVSTYNSTQNGNIIRFVETYWPELIEKDQNHYMYSIGYTNRDASELTGVRYILKHTSDPDVPGTHVWKTFGDVTVLVDPQVTSICSFYANGSFEDARDGCTVSFAQRDESAIISMSRGENSSEYMAKANVDQDGLLFTAIPYENGWTCEVDGKELDHMPVNLGFIGVRLTKGEHTITYRYRCPGVFGGLVMSLISLGLCLGFLWMKKKGRMNRGISNYTV